MVDGAWSVNIYPWATFERGRAKPQSFGNLHMAQSSPSCGPHSSGLPLGIFVRVSWHGYSLGWRVRAVLRASQKSQYYIDEFEARLRHLRSVIHALFITKHGNY